MQQVLDYLHGVVVGLLRAPFDPGERFYFLYLLTFVAFAYVAYRVFYNGGRSGKTRTPFFAFLFPKRTYLHPSARIDYTLFLLNRFLSPFTGMFGVALNSAASMWVALTLLSWHGGTPLFTGEWSLTVGLLFIVGFTMAADLAVYVVHRAHHASSVLWPIHALHHSAEVLTPVTLFRKHPLWNLTANALTAAFTGLFQGGFIFVFYGTPDYSMLLGVNTLYAAFNFFASNLRHSHVWLSWGRPLSYVFVSPAMHQIHHDPTRMRRNYGEIFALWDLLFGTLYVPREREQFAIGLPDGNPHSSVARAYYVPLLEAGRALRARLLPGRK